MKAISMAFPLALMLLIGPVSAAEFIRGDANGDGQASVSDAVSVHRRDRHLLELWNFAPQP